MNTKGANTRPPRIYVVAGVNGSGKSSIGGAMIRASGANYYNPDEGAKKILEAHPGIPVPVANGLAWEEGKERLEQAIAQRLDFPFETTLAGETMTALLEQAIVAGIEVWIWYVGVDSPDLCIARVKARVASGGHDIPETKIRECAIRCPLNLIRLLPKVARLQMYDNTLEGDPKRGKQPQPRLILKMEKGYVTQTCDLTSVPEWAKPIVAVAIKRQEPRRKKRLR